MRFQRGRRREGSPHSMHEVYCRLALKAQQLDQTHRQHDQEMAWVGRSQGGTSAPALQWGCCRRPAQRCCAPQPHAGWCSSPDAFHAMAPCQPQPLKTPVIRIKAVYESSLSQCILLALPQHAYAMYETSQPVLQIPDTMHDPFQQGTLTAAHPALLAGCASGKMMAISVLCSMA